MAHSAPDGWIDTGGLCRGSDAHNGCLDCEVRPISVCGALEMDELGELSSISERCRYGARAPIAFQDDPADFVYNITSGVVRVFKYLPDGGRQIVGFLLPGDFFGLALSDRFAFSADAVVAATACKFARTRFLDFLGRKPHLMRRLHEAAAHELTVAQNQLVLLGKAKAETRVLAFLLNLRERWARNCGKLSPTVALPMGRADIGDYLGITIETVSRTLTQLAREKVIVIVPNGVRLLNVSEVKRRVAGGPPQHLGASLAGH